MSYKRVVKKRGKTYGPYIYESYRDKDGRVRKRYLGKAKKETKISSFLVVVLLLSFVISAGYTTDVFFNHGKFYGKVFETGKGIVGNITGFAVSEKTGESSGEGKAKTGAESGSKKGSEGKSSGAGSKESGSKKGGEEKTTSGKSEGGAEEKGSNGAGEGAGKTGTGEETGAGSGAEESGTGEGAGKTGTGEEGVGETGTGESKTDKTGTGEEEAGKKGAGEEAGAGGGAEESGAGEESGGGGSSGGAGESEKENKTGGAGGGEKLGGTGENQTSGGGASGGQNNLSEEKNISEETKNKTSGNLNKTIGGGNVSEGNFSGNFSGINKTGGGLGGNLTNLSQMNNTFLNKTKEEINKTLEISKFNLTTFQYKAVAGRPVKWIKVVKINKRGELFISLPKEAVNISVLSGGEIQKALDEIKEYESIISKKKKEIATGVLTGHVSKDISNSEGILTRFWKWLTGFSVSGNVIKEGELKLNITKKDKEILVDLGNLSDGKSIAVVYYTPAPKKKETKIKNGKEIKISADEDLNYTNILAYANLSDMKIKVNDSRFRIYWTTDYNEALKLGYVNKTKKGKNPSSVRVSVRFNASDFDDDGFLDYAEWEVPHLSEQTFQLVVEVTKAEHLDKNRTDIASIYNEVRALDNNWSEKIYNGEYVRVTFEQKLNSKRDITIYPRNTQGKKTKVVVYLEDSNKKIAEFPIISDEKYYKVYLDNMTGEHDVFDLKVVNLDGDDSAYLEFDHIVDPGWKDHDSFGYLGKDSYSEDVNYFWEDIISTGTKLDLADDGYQSDIDPGFSISFYGNSVRNLTINNNGLFYFDTGTTTDGAFWGNENIPNTNDPDDAVYAFWDDLGPNGNVYYETKGSAPNRYFIVQWETEFLSGGGNLSIEAVFYENSSDIQFNYKNVSSGQAGDNGASATVGIENGAGSIALKRSYNEASLSNEYAVRFFYTNKTQLEAWNVEISPGSPSDSDDFSVDFDSVLSTEDVVDWRVDGDSLAIVNMPFAKNISSTTFRAVKDYSTWKNNGTLGNGTSAYAPVWVSDGMVGGAYDFNQSHYIEIPNSPSLENVTDSDHTFEAWVKPRHQLDVNTRRYGTIISRPNYAEILHYTNNSYFAFEFYNNSNSWFGIWSSTSFPENQWYHVVATVDDSAKIAKLYINGTQVGSTSYNGPLKDHGTVPYRIGITGIPPGASWDLPFNGTIDQVRIYNRALSARQVKANYDSERQKLSWNKIVNDTTSTEEEWGAAVTPVNATDEGATNYSNNVAIMASFYTPCDYYLTACKTSGWESGKKYCLNASISTFSDCMVIDNNSVYLDLRGHTISGISIANGIKAENHSGLTIRNGTITKLFDGIYLKNISGVTIENLVVDHSFNGLVLRDVNDSNFNSLKMENRYTSFSLEYSKNTNIRNSVANGSQVGFYLNCLNVNLENISGVSNLRGLTILNSINIQVNNSNFSDNQYEDVAFSISSAYSDSYCNHYFENVTGSGGKPIEFYDSAVNLANKQYAELILCDADGSSLTNITVDDEDDSWKNNALYVWRTENSVFNKIYANDSYHGLYIIESSDNNFSDLHFYNVSYEGIYLKSGERNNFSDVVINNSGHQGVIILNATSSFFYGLNSTENPIGFSINESYNTYIDSYSNLKENTQNDLEILALSDAQCNHQVYADGSNDHLITFYNSSVDDDSQVYSELILCNADNSNVTNMFISASSSFNNNGIYVYRSSNVNITNPDSKNNFYGILMKQDSNNCTVSSAGLDSNENSGLYIENSSYIVGNDITANSNKKYGIYIKDSFGNNFQTTNTTNNTESGVYLDYVNDSIFNGVESYSNKYGIYAHYSGNNLFKNIREGNPSRDDFEFEGSNNNTIKNAEFRKSQNDGVHFKDSANNALNNVSVYNATLNAFYFDNSGSNKIRSSQAIDNAYGIAGSFGFGGYKNYFTNINVSGSTVQEANLIGPLGTDIYSYLVFNNSNAEIRWTDDKFITNFTIKGGLTMGGSVDIGYNYAYLNSSNFVSPSNINSYANITFNNMPGNFHSPVILRDGKYVCDDTTTPRCHNFTSLNAETVVFNVSSWSNYSISSETIPPNINFTDPTPSNGSSLFDNEGVYVNVSSSDANPHYTFLDMDKSLVLWMRMDDVDSSGDPWDRSSYSHNGSAQGGAEQNTTSGMFGKSFTFDGSSGYIDLGTITELDNLLVNEQPFTLSFWFNMAQNPSVWGIDFSAFAQDDGSGSGEIWAKMRASDDHLSSDFGGMPDSLDLGAINSGIWYHVVYTFDGNNNFSGYLNGSIVDSNGAVNPSDDDGSFFIGTEKTFSNFFWGEIDEVLIFNRILNASEIRALYNATANQYYNNFSGLGLGDHNFKAYAVDNSGNINETETRNITIKSSAPNDPTNVVLNATDVDNRTLRDLKCYANLSDPDDETLTVYVEWYLEDSFNLSQTYTGVNISLLFNATLNYGNTSKHQNWSCGVRSYDGAHYSNWVNSSKLEIENTPPVVALVAPSDWSSTIDRTPTFSWSASDDDGDSMTYDWNLTDYQFSGAYPCSDKRLQNSLPSQSYTPTNDLLCFWEHGYYYLWSVRANDGEAYGDWAGNHRLNLTANLSILLTTSDVNFGLMDPGTVNDTADNSPSPMIIENQGNAKVNVSINSSSLWDDEPGESKYYQFKIDNVTSEVNSFNWAGSITSWFNVSIGSNILAINELKYPDSNDSAEIDYRLEVPINEPPGTKNADVVLTSVLAE